MKKAASRPKAHTRTGFDDFGFMFMVSPRVVVSLTI
jgi:hypothetical protein